MSIWTPAMYGFNGPTGCNAPDCFPGQAPVSPLGPGWEQDRWWFRGPMYRSAAPDPKDAAVLTAGGSWKVEITCHKDYTSYGTLTTTTGSVGECCPDNGKASGLYHAHVEGSEEQTIEGVAGCALGIADATSPDDVTMDSIVIFSVQKTCVWTRETEFKIPAAMPACSGEYCLCSWYWLAAVDLPNFYMTGFYCKIDGATSTIKWAPPRDAVFCGDDSSKCVTGARKPLFAYNTPTNTPDWDATNPNAKRPAYGPTWGFADGAQDDIFTGGSISTGNTTTGGINTTTTGGSKTVESPTGNGASTTKDAAQASATTPTADMTGGGTVKPTTTGTGSGGGESGTDASSSSNITETSSSSSAPSINPLIIGGAVAGALLLAIVAFIIGRQRSQQKAQAEQTAKTEEEKKLKSHSDDDDDSSSDGDSGSDSD